jgi:hypothetical protein
MAIVAGSSKVHWNYFLALDQDAQVASRYVEFAAANFQTYSIEFARLLLAAASEVDVVAKLLCEQLQPGSSPGKIDDYRVILMKHIPEIADLNVFVPRYGLTLRPWENWASNKSPDWWRSYNAVKHQRDVSFTEATVQNTLNALGALLIVVFYHYRFGVPQGSPPLTPKETTRGLLPSSALLELPGQFYHSVRIA